MTDAPSYKYKISVKETRYADITVSAKTALEARSIAEKQLANNEAVISHAETNIRCDIISDDHADESTDNDNKCPYCNIHNDTGQIINNASNDFTIMKHDDETTASLTTGNREFHILHIKYCPICGRNLESMK